MILRDRQVEVRRGRQQVQIVRSDLTVQFLHGDQIKRLQGVSVGSDEIQADVDPRVMAVKQGAFYF